MGHTPPKSPKLLSPAVWKDKILKSFRASLFITEAERAAARQKIVDELKPLALLADIEINHVNSEDPSPRLGGPNQPHSTLIQLRKIGKNYWLTTDSWDRDEVACLLARMANDLP